MSQHEGLPRASGATADTDATLAVHAARFAADGREPGVPIAEPIVQAANFLLSEAIVADLGSSGGLRSYSYSRLANPTVESAARVVAALEGAEDAVVTSSGMAAITASLLALTPPGGRILTARELHGETSYLMATQLEPLGYRVQRVPLATLGRAGHPPGEAPDVVYVETLSNPMLRVADVAAIAAAAHRDGALCIVDDTFTSPLNCKPLALGADLVVASATKYLNGHSDVVSGVLCGPAPLVARVRDHVTVTGCSADPFAAYLLSRGLKTLPLRIARQNATALQLATALVAHPGVELVAYPFVEGHPDHGLARSVLAGGGGIVTVRVQGGDERAHELQRHLRIVQPATSLGGVESVVCVPAETSHLTLTDEERFALDILPGSLRFSFGIEDPGDLWEDLSQALRRSAAVPGP